MPAYRIDIDGRIYEGHYDSKPNAVFGAMCKDSIDRNRAARTTSNGYFALRQEDAQPSLIGVEIVTGRKVAKKIHKVLDTEHWTL